MGEVASSLPNFSKGKGLAHYQSAALPTARAKPLARSQKADAPQQSAFARNLSPVKRSVQGEVFTPSFLARNPSFAPQPTSLPTSLPPLSPDSVSSKPLSLHEQMLRAMQKYRVAAELQG